MVIGKEIGVCVCVCVNVIQIPSRPPSRSRKPLWLAEDILRLASQLAVAYG